MTSNGSYNRNDVYQGSYGRSNYSYGETNPIPMHTNQAPPPYSEFFQEPPLQYSPHNYPYIQQALPPTQMANYNFLHVPPAHPNFQNFHQTFNVTPTQHYYSQNNQPHYIQQRHYTQQPQYLRQSFVRQPFTRQHFNPYASPSREYNNRFQGRGRGNFRNNRHVQSRRGRTIDLHSVSGGRGNFNRFGRRSRQQRQPIRSRMNKPDIYITNAENVSEKIDLSSIDFFSTEGKENKYQYHRSDTIIFYPVHAVSIRENRSEGRICVKKKQTGSSEPPRRMCENCERIETGRKWCSCYKAIFERNFINWSSGYENIDHFLRKAQQEANSVCELLEWIPYNRLRNILFVKKGGFGAVYSGIWCDGRIQRWDGNSGDWQRYGEEKVALKSLKISEDISNKFLSELEKYYICTKKVSHVLRSFGITKNPKNNELYMVMEWAENGNLQEYLQKNGRMNGRRMTWINKLNLLDSIANGLETIHREKLTHGDLHSGNILINREGWVLIGDMGFSKCYEHLEAMDSKDQRSVHGVIPYIAPEVLEQKPYTPSADIYSFGMLMYEIYHEYPPFNRYENDLYLVMKIIDGKRPECNERIQKSYYELMDKCWSGDESKRPSAKEIIDSLNRIRREIGNENFNSPKSRYTHRFS